MSYYKICKMCGAYLDPGEVCECKKETVVNVGSNDNGIMKNVFPKHFFPEYDNRGNRKNQVKPVA